MRADAPVPRQWAALAGVLALAIVMRWLGYTGFFGSDGITYLINAWRPLDGDWRVDDYVGANRFGVNLPMAAFGAVFGRTEFAAAAYALSCSAAEVLLVTWFSTRHFGLRVGVAAGVVMATLPNHVHFAGQMLADPPLALSISAAFVLFFEAERRHWTPGYFLAGVAAGLSFWIKPVTQFVYAVLLFYPLLVRRWDHRWLWMVVGMLLTMAANFVLFMVLTGDFWFLLEAIARRRRTGYLAAGMEAGSISTHPAVYLHYLFVKIYHTGLLAYAALIAGLLILRRRLPVSAVDGGAVPAVRFVLLWGLGLLTIMSLMPAGLDPLVWVPKQINYMTIFAAPLSVLAGLGLAALRRPWNHLALLGAAAVGIGFALLLQANTSVFTANSWRTLDYVREHPDKTVHVMSNATQAAKFESLLYGRDVQSRLGVAKDVVGSPSSQDRIVVIDPETFGWDSRRPFARLVDVPSCWVGIDTLRGNPRGAGVAFVRALRRAAQVLPGSVGRAADQRLERLSEPRPAQVYRVPAGC